MGRSPGQRSWSGHRRGTHGSDERRESHDGGVPVSESLGAENYREVSGWELGQGVSSDHGREHRATSRGSQSQASGSNISFSAEAGGYEEERFVGVEQVGRHQAWSGDEGWTQGSETGSALADCQAGVEGLAESSLAPATREKYRSAWHDWCAFRDQGRESVASGHQLMLAYIWAGFKSDHRTPLRIWVLGHSYIHWARLHRAAKDTSLFKGAMVVQWIGRRGLRWSGFRHLLSSYVVVQGVPQVLVIHLGGNDIGGCKSVDLILRIQEDLAWVQASWPSLVICWSDIVPRMAWRAFPEGRVADGVRRKINSVVSRFLRSMGGWRIVHPSIRYQSPSLYRGDGVHLSDEGMVIFVRDIYVFLASEGFSMVAGRGS
ncbi:uncharacterized protein LOC142144468 isoform X1 [Mixophyes fleayi]|uniref:uncharacterized protein LOC142144468 isoform X1 n=1 Tax=Mixophyes fleayi TaxID=3061075 RepID=UPI003F4E1CF2